MTLVEKFFQMVLNWMYLSWCIHSTSSNAGRPLNNPNMYSILGLDQLHIFIATDLSSIWRKIKYFSRLRLSCSNFHRQGDFKGNLLDGKFIEKGTWLCSPVQPDSQRKAGLLSPFSQFSCLRTDNFRFFFINKRTKDKLPFSLFANG
jgi:hypothetical protein